LKESPDLGKETIDQPEIAAGDPDLWTAIFINNARPVADQLSCLILRLQEFHDALDATDADAVRRLLETAKGNRDALDGVSGTDS